jgi:DNA topoisomerase-1
MAVDQSPLIAARHAKKAGLCYVYDADPGISRRRRGRGFVYFRVRGGVIRDAATLARCKKLAVPPAWTAVWICPRANGHIQATGLDARGRKQYRYHEDWRTARDRTKFETMAAFGAALPALRRKVSAALARPGLPRERVIAAVVRLLDRTGLRVGNDAYRTENHSYGLTTLNKTHVERHGREIALDFPAKGGKVWQGELIAPKVAKVITACSHLPGYRLFKFRDDDGKIHAIDSGAVNGWLQDISGSAHLTAKDFRTWHACVLFIEAAAALPADEKLPPLKDILGAVAAQLGNTSAILKKSYVHPNLIDLYQAGVLQTRAWRPKGKRAMAGLSQSETLLLRWLRKQYE